ncbi:hypothetical protein Plhal304r1_c008g0033761 [Plasmopara halstedii]
MRYLLTLFVVAVFAVSNGTTSSTTLDKTKNDIIDASTALTEPQNAIVNTRQSQSQSVGEAEEERAWPIIHQAHSYLKSSYDWLVHLLKRMFGVETPASRKWYHIREHFRGFKRGSRRMYYNAMGRIRSAFRKMNHISEENKKIDNHLFTEGLQREKHGIQESFEHKVHKISEYAQNAKHTVERGGKRAGNFIKTGHV